MQALLLFPLKSFVVLYDGSIAHVLRRNPTDYALPIVLRVQDSQRKLADHADDANLIDLAAGQITVRQALPTPGKNEVALNPEFLNQARDTSTR